MGGLSGNIPVDTLLMLDMKSAWDRTQPAERDREVLRVPILLEAEDTLGDIRGFQGFLSSAIDIELVFEMIACGFGVAVYRRMVVLSMWKLE